MYFGGITLNLLTMFGLLVTLGMLTDDAIVVAENIQAETDSGGDSDEGSIKAANQVAWPVLGTVSTSIVAFLPLMFVKGQVGELLGALPLVVLCALAASYIESILISRATWRPRFGDTGSSVRSDHGSTGPGLCVAGSQAAGRGDPDVLQLHSKALRYRYITTAAALAMLMFSLGMVLGRRVPFVFLPVNDAENLLVDVRMPTGVSIEQTSDFVARVESAARTQSETSSVSTILGTSFDVATGEMNASNATSGQIFLELKPIEQRDRSSAEVIDSIRAELGDVSEAEELAFSVLDGGRVVRTSPSRSRPTAVNRCWVRWRRWRSSCPASPESTGW